MSENDIVAALVSDSRQGLPLMKSPTLLNLALSLDEERRATDYTSTNADYTCYHVLFALRRRGRAAYQRLPAETKAKILAGALAHLQYFNDWGSLDPSSSHDGEAAEALLELGIIAVEPLAPLLDNTEPAMLFGSEPAAISHSFKYRRADFAYRYLSLLLGLDPPFDADPQERDKKIERLKVRLKEAGK